jgi:subtilisin family serine protease
MGDGEGGRAPDLNALALALIGLPPVMAQDTGRPAVRLAVVDGPVRAEHPRLAGTRVVQLAGPIGSECGDAACAHGTFVAGILAADRDSAAPGICPGCTLLVRPIFGEHPDADTASLQAAPAALADAILDCVSASADVINLSVTTSRPSIRRDDRLTEALTMAARRGTIVVAAAGNQGMVGGSPITRHPWVVPVVACDHAGVPLSHSNLSASIGRRGVSAPGHLTGLGLGADLVTRTGTSCATALVAGALALLKSLVPGATASDVRTAAVLAATPRRRTISPPVLDAAAAYMLLMSPRHAHPQPPRGGIYV